MIIKLTLSVLTSFVYLRPYNKNYRFALLGAILYAFSGYQLFNIFYNHFQDVCVFAPLLLWSLDRLMEDKYKGAFALCVFINAMVNYVFFVGSVVFVIIYFIIKVICKEYELSFKKILRIAFESVIGFSASLILVLPAVLSLIGNSRVNSTISGIDMLIYKSEFRHYLEIVRALFFPSDTPHIEPFFPKNATIRWTGPSLYIPLFGFCGVLAQYLKKGNKFYKVINSTILIFMFIPVLNSSFNLFNSAYYARWFYFPVLIFALSTVILLDKIEETKESIKISSRICFITTAILGLLVIFIPVWDNEGNFRLGLYKEIDLPFTLFYIAIALSSLLLIYVIFSCFKSKTLIIKSLFAAVSIAVILIGTINIIMLCSCYPDSKTYKQKFIEGNDFLSDNDDSYRIDTSGIHYNAHMWWEKASLATFNSTISGKEIEFYNNVGYNRYVATIPNQSYYGLRYLTSVRYCFYNDPDDCLLPGYELVGQSNGYYLFENKNYIPMGFCYLNYISYDDFELVSKEYKDKVLLKGILLSDEQIKNYASRLGRLDIQDLMDSFSNYNSIESDVLSLRNHSGYYFKWNDNGFTSKIELRAPNLVFYSVPYDEGFKAYVNGSEVKIEEVNGGLMAVWAPTGDNTIEFVYEPMGLKTGAIISLFSIFLLIIYILIGVLRGKRKNEKN